MGKKIQCIGRYVMDGQTLGKGNFARVELAHHSITGVQVAIKIIDRSKLKEEYQKDHLHREARILGQLRHPNIVRLYETLKATTLHCLVLELANGGELQTFIRCHKDGRLPEDKSRPFIRQLVSALHYLHERGVAHRDLKMENIMLDEKQKNVKLVDFGLSITFNKDELMKTHCGSPEYAAPELFAAKDKYGPEIDVWSLGIVMYAMMLGRLPFTTPYTDHYRRQKLVQQMEKGLTDSHTAEMTILSQDCQDMLRKVIEPSPDKRMPLLDMEVHAWVTNSAKLPFFPFQAFPKDRTMRHQGSPSLRQQPLQDSVCSTDDDETVSELCKKLELKKEQVEQTVGETKSDEVSAMYNMMLDAKRREQGLFDIDHTSKPMERRDGRTKRRAKSAPEEKKSRRKGGVPPALVLPAPEVAGDSAPHTGTEGTAEPETRMTSFDFLALCSAPTWLGPERRRSRRRARSPNPAAQHNKSSDGMSVRSQLRRDFMERQQMEQQAAADKAEHQSSHPPPSHPAPGHSSGGLSPNLLSPDQAIPGHHQDSEGTNPRLHRGSSLKLSRKRARSFGPRQKRRSNFQRSGSVDTPMQAEAESSGQGRLQGAKSDSLATASPSTLSVAAASLAVAYGGRTSNVLKVPEPKVGPSLQTENPTIKENQAVQNPPNSASLSAPEAAAGIVQGVAADGRGSVADVEVHGADRAQPSSPAVPSQVSAASDRQGTGSGTDLKVPRVTDRLQLPTTFPNLSADTQSSWSTESLLGDSEVNLLPSPDGASTGSGPLVQPLHLLDCSQRPVFHQQVPPHALSLPQDGPLSLADGGEDGATAMQAGMPGDSPLPGASPLPDFQSVRDSAKGRGAGEGSREGVCASLEPGLRALTLDGLVGATGISGNFKDEDDLLANEVDVTMEEDLVFPGEAEPARQQYLATLPDSGAEGGVLDTTAPYTLPSPEELIVRTHVAPVGAAPPAAPSPPVDVARRNKRGSAGSHSQSSSGSHSQKRGSVSLQGGKLKTPTTPLSWMVLHSPLARIESFHSDEFELFNSSDNDSAEPGEVTSASPMSANTPTLPCFAYKLPRARKKLSKLKMTSADHADGKGGKKANHCCNDVGRCHTQSTQGMCSPEPTAADPLLTCGGDTDHLDDSADKAIPAGKAKVHPEDKDCEKMLLKTETKPAVCNNVITQQPKRQAQQNSVNSCVPSLALDSAKSLGSKSPPWKRSFVYFLKRKKPSPRCNNNNNDCASSPMLPANHNGCSPTSPTKKVESNNVQTSLSAKPLPANAIDCSGDLSGEIGNCKPRVYVPASDSTATDGPEFQSSFPGPPTSPDAGLGTRVFDFTLLNDSPKGRPCLLSWRPCGDCATSDLSSEDESECNPDPVVTLDLKSLAHNNVGDRSHSFHPSYQCSGT